MIGIVRGRLEARTPVSCTVFVPMGEDGGVALEIQIPLSVSERLGEVGEVVTLYTVLHVTREGPVLYGFDRERDRDLFRELIRLPGIGPGLALRLLSGPDAEVLLSAVETGDVETLASIKGIGRKRAERIIFELRGRLSALRVQEADRERLEDVARALQALGIPRKDAHEAALEAQKALGQEASLEELIRKALSLITR